MYLTYQYRIKCKSAEKRLNKIGYKVNRVWNYLNGLEKQNFQSWKWGCKGHHLSYKEATDLTSGSSKIVGLDSHVIQEVAKAYVEKRETKDKFHLRFRKYKKSLGWIPFKNVNIKHADNKNKFDLSPAKGKYKGQTDAFNFSGKTYRFWKHRDFPIGGKLKSGSFSQDAKRNWYVNFVFEVNEPVMVHPEIVSTVGIDLGLKTIATLSDGSSYDRQNITKQYEVKLATAQRAKKRNQVRAIHTKIKNVRKDFTHKVSNDITKRFVSIKIGDVKSKEIIEKLPNAAKNVNDAAWYDLKIRLQYKAKRQGGMFKEVNEAYSTQDCSSCKARTGPKGIAGLKIRSWTCSECGVVHDRDVNSAINISVR